MFAVAVPVSGVEPARIEPKLPRIPAAVTRNLLTASERRSINNELAALAVFVRFDLIPVGKPEVFQVPEISKKGNVPDPVIEPPVTVRGVVSFAPVAVRFATEGEDALTALPAPVEERPPNAPALLY